MISRIPGHLKKRFFRGSYGRIFAMFARRHSLYKTMYCLVDNLINAKKENLNFQRERAYGFVFLIQP